jgi:hypothetical protein
LAGVLSFVKGIVSPHVIASCPILCILGEMLGMDFPDNAATNVHRIVSKGEAFRERAAIYAQTGPRK